MVLSLASIAPLGAGAHLSAQTAPITRSMILVEGQLTVG